MTVSVGLVLGTIGSRDHPLRAFSYPQGSNPHLIWWLSGRGTRTSFYVLDLVLCGQCRPTVLANATASKMAVNRLVNPAPASSRPEAAKREWTSRILGVRVRTTRFRPPSWDLRCGDGTEHSGPHWRETVPDPPFGRRLWRKPNGVRSGNQPGVGPEVGLTLQDDALPGPGDSRIGYRGGR